VILLLMLLAMVLPFRGALAGVTHCAGASSRLIHAVATPQHADVHQHADAHQHAVAHHHDAAHHHQQAQPGSQDPGASAQAGDASASMSDPCNLCTASCASPPILAAPLTLAQPQPVAASPYPALDAPPPSHPSEGQERPPRSI